MSQDPTNPSNLNHFQLLMPQTGEVRNRENLEETKVRRTELKSIINLTRPQLFDLFDQMIPEKLQGLIKTEWKEDIEAYMRTHDGREVDFMLVRGRTC